MLKQFIKDSGVSQREWAQRLGITEGYLSRILSGEKKPSLDLAAEIERQTGKAIMAASWSTPPDLAPSITAYPQIRAAE